MISSLRGIVLDARGHTLIVEVGGVGFATTVLPEHASTLRVGSETMVHTALVVRDDELSLFGFEHPEQLTAFELLRGVTGVGPRSAMSVLAAMSPDDIAHSVAHEDDGAFRKISGIGPKTAKLIVLSLTGKLAALATTIDRGARSSHTSISENVTIALVGLGWAERTAAQAVEDALAGASETEGAAVPSLLRLALTRLGPTKSNGTS